MKQFLLRAKEAASLLSQGGGVRLAAGAFRCYLQLRSCCDRFRCLSSITGSQPLSHSKYIGAACELGNPPAVLPCGKSIRQRRQTFFGRADGKEGGAPSKGNEECQSLSNLQKSSATHIVPPSCGLSLSLNKITTTVLSNWERWWSTTIHISGFYFY